MGLKENLTSTNKGRKKMKTFKTTHKRKDTLISLVWVWLVLLLANSVEDGSIGVHNIQDS